MSEKLVSIIVPVYNTRKYLKKCLESLLNQTYSNIEIIVVDDGSTDDSYELCKRYSDDDKRIKLFQKNNEGAQLARKYGMSKMSNETEFVTFVDSDDFLSYDAIEKSINKINDSVDVVVFLMYKYCKIMKIKSYFSLEENITHEMFMEKYYKGFFGASLFPVSLCGKLYRKSLFDDIVYHNNFMGDDLCVNMQIMPKVRNFSVINEPLYYYRFGGNTSKFNKYFLDDYQIIKSLQKQCIDEYDLKRFYRSVHVETANVFYSFIKSYVESDEFDENLAVGFIKDSYEKYGFISDASEFFKKQDINDIKSEIIQRNIRLITNFNEENYLKAVKQDLRKEKRSIKFILKHILKKLI